jgi:peptidoglycan/LPS O-acetylase OafA/YrhL
MGRISYTFYLIHLLFLEWAMANTARSWTENNSEEEFTRNDASLYVFLIYTPIIILVSWLMEIAIDTPSKDLAGEIDRELRVIPMGQKNKKKKSCCEFVWTNWKIYSLIIWLLSIFIITELFGIIDK